MRHEPDPDLPDLDEDYPAVLSPYQVIERVRQRLHRQAPHPQSSEKLPTPEYAEFEIPKTSWLTQRLGLSPKRLKLFIVSRLVCTGEWLTPPQYEFLIGLIREYSLEISPQTEEAKRRRLSDIKELNLDTLIVSLLQLLPPGTEPDEYLLKVLRLELSVMGLSTLSNKRTYDGFSPLYDKALKRIVYIKKQRPKPREPRRRRSSEDHGGKASGRSRGPLHLSMEAKDVEKHSPWIEYPVIRDFLILSSDLDREKDVKTTA